MMNMKKYLLLMMLVGASSFSLWSQNSTVKPLPTEQTVDYHTFTYNWTDANGGTHTSYLDEKADNTRQIMALLNAVYTNPAVPGYPQQVGYFDNGQASGNVYDIDYNAHLHKYKCTLPYATYGGEGGSNHVQLQWYADWISDSTAYRNGQVLASPEVGATTLLVEVKNSYDPKPMENKLESAPAQEGIEKKYQSAHVINSYMRVNDATNPGYMFTIEEVTTDRFFFITKGKYDNRPEGCSPLWFTFEQISPTAGAGAQVTTNFASLMNQGKVYSCVHDCPDVPSIENTGHYFTLSGGTGEASAMNNLTLFVPDKRYPSAAYAGDETHEGNWGGVAYNPNYAPKVFLYKASLTATAVPTVDVETSHKFNVTLNWASWFTKEKIGADVDEQYFVYTVNADGTFTPLIDEDHDGKADAVPFTTYTYQVDQLSEGYTITYVVTVNPIQKDANGNVYNVSTIKVNTNTDFVLIPPYEPTVLVESLGYRSRYDVVNQLNRYKNNFSVKPGPKYESLVDSKVYRKAIGSNDKVEIATIEFKKKTVDGATQYDYNVTYFNQDPDTLRYDKTKQVTSGTLTSATDNFEIIDFFHASTEKNVHPTGYEYSVENSERHIDVPVRKSTNVSNPETITYDEFLSDEDHHLSQGDKVDVTFAASQNIQSSVITYHVYHTADYLWNCIHNPDPDHARKPVCKAERYQLDRFALIGIAEDGTLSDHIEDRSVGYSMDKPTDLTAADNLRYTGQPTETNANYVTVITALSTIKKSDGSIEAAMNTYGTNITNVQMPKLELELVSSEKSEPWAGATGPMRGYRAVLKLTPTLPDEGKGSCAFYYRVWRVVDGEETLLNTATPEQSGEGQSGKWDGGNYDDIVDPWPGPEPVEINDLFNAPATLPKSVNYIARLYTTDVDGIDKAPRRAEGDSESKDYLITEQTIGVTFNDQTITGIGIVNTLAQPVETYYYNEVGVRSSVPFRGFNIMVTRYSDGTTTTSKVVK